MAGHPTTRLITPQGEHVDIDIEIAPIIEALWRLGIPTVQCCQGPWDDYGYGFIEFPSAAAVEAFLDALRLEPTKDADSLYQRVGDGYLSDVYPDRWRIWRYDVQPWPDHDVTPARFECAITVSFPPSDLPELTRRLLDVAPAPD
jgi:hypothetical protein